MATLTGVGFTQDMYQRLRREVGWEKDPIDGWLVHAVYWDEKDRDTESDQYDPVLSNQSGHALEAQLQC
jgi:hypothetical protein